jgi:hypothetical protein
LAWAWLGSRWWPAAEHSGNIAASAVVVVDVHEDVGSSPLKFARRGVAAQVAPDAADGPHQ